VTGIETEGGTYIPEKNRAVGKISDLWVEPAYRGRGIARALIRMAEARLRAAGVRRAEISAIPANADALRLYRSLGYSDYLVTVGRML
jgi:ribosomal protein S18 acetylase RimI-like enzyme